MRRARSCWPRRSRMTRRGCGRCAGRCCAWGWRWSRLTAGRVVGGAAVGRGAAGAGLASQPGRGHARSVPRVGGKSDRFDAFVLCELARTDHLSPRPPTAHRSPQRAEPTLMGVTPIYANARFCILRAQPRLRRQGARSRRSRRRQAWCPRTLSPRFVSWRCNSAGPAGARAKQSRRARAAHAWIWAEARASQARRSAQERKPPADKGSARSRAVKGAGR
jgi:hypothetical protein